MRLSSLDSKQTCNVPQSSGETSASVLCCSLFCELLGRLLCETLFSDRCAEAVALQLRTMLFFPFCPLSSSSNSPKWPLVFAQYNWRPVGIGCGWQCLWSAFHATLLSAPFQGLFGRFCSTEGNRGHARVGPRAPLGLGLFPVCRRWRVVDASFWAVDRLHYCTWLCRWCEFLLPNLEKS